MKKVVLVPDSFKGSMSAVTVCSIMKDCIMREFPRCEIISLPVADGGEGSVDCFLSGGGKKVHATVTGPFFEPVESFYGVIENGKTAVIEMAACAGLPMVEGRANPSLTTTFGVGELIVHAANLGCDKIILCLGGSCTNDAGAGAAAACGIQFYNAAGNTFVPTGGTLKDIVRIDAGTLDPVLKNVEFVTMCDIDSPLYGEQGAAYVFAPQKGADEEMVRQLDDGLRHIAALIARDLHTDVADLAGGGAAGGMGAGAYAFWGARLEMGIEVVLQQFHFDELIRGADIVFSGEGRIDSQSLRGKVVIGVARAAQKHGVPVVAVVGDIIDPIEPIYDEGVSAVFSINRVAKPFAEVRSRSAQDLALTMNNLIRFYRLIAK